MLAETVTFVHFFVTNTLRNLALQAETKPKKGVPSHQAIGRKTAVGMVHMRSMCLTYNRII
jgi:hypothetical protein